MMKLLVVFTLMFCTVVLHTQDFGTIHLLQMADVATLGCSYTLICTWEPSEDSSVTVVKWIGGPSGLTFIVVNATTCEIEKSTVSTSNLLITTGYRYQTLKLLNVTKELNGSEWVCLNDIGASSSNIIVDKQHSVTLSPLCPTTWYGSNFTFICSCHLEPGIGISSWYLNGRPQFSLSEESCEPLNANYKTTCTKYRHMVTLKEVTSDDNGDMWQCSVARSASNRVRVTAFADPEIDEEYSDKGAQNNFGFPSNVSILRKPDTDQGSNWQALTCGTTCEEQFSFNWDVDIRGDFSPVHYNSCNSICSQTLTLYVDESDHGKLVQCTITNERTGKRDSAQYEIVSRDHGIPTSYNTSSTAVSAINRAGSSAINSNSNSITIAAAASGTLITILLIVSVILVVCLKVITKSKTKGNVNNDHTHFDVVYLNARPVDYEEIHDKDNRLGNGCYLNARHEHYEEIQDGANRLGNGCYLNARHVDYAEIQDDDNRLGNDGYLDARHDYYAEIQDGGNRNQYACPAQVSRDMPNTYSKLSGSENHSNIHEYKEIHVYSDLIL